MLFLTAAAAIAWVLLGWPLWLYWRARNRPRPFRRDGQPLPCTILICVKNGASYLRQKLDSVLQLDYPPELRKILVASDGSTDETEAIAREYEARGVQLLCLPGGGKSRAITSALPYLEGEILVITDVRQALDRQSLRKLVACFGDPTVGVVSGELLIRDAATLQEVAIGAYWRFETWIRNCMSRVDSMLGATGPYYAIRRRLVRPVPDGTLLDDVYIPLGAFFEGYRLVMEPGALAYDYPTSAQTEFRRKVRTMAGNYQLLRLYPQLLFKNRLLLDYVSYKLGRLLLPIFLILLFAGTFGLPEPWRMLAFAGQAFVYGLALVDLALPDGFPGKKLTSAARVFVVMMIAALCGISVWFVEPTTLWQPTQIPTRPPGEGKAAR